MRVDALVVGFHGDFGTLSGIARHFADVQQSVCDFGHFLLEQFAQKFAGCAAQQDLLAAAVKFFHAQKQGADFVAAAIVFARQHLVARNQRIQFRCQFHHNAVPLDTFHRADHNVFARGQKRIQNLLAFGIADALQNNLFCGLRGLAAEGFVRNVFFKIIAHIDVDAGDFFLNLLDGFFQFGIGIVQILHNQPFAHGAVFARVAVDAHFQVHVFAVGLFLGGNAQRHFQRFKHHIGFNVFLACQSLYQCQNFTTHLQCSLLFLFLSITGAGCFSVSKTRLPLIRNASVRRIKI